VERLAQLGVRRISVGGSLARCAWTSFLEAARAIAVSGSFSGLDGLATNAILNKLHGEEGRS
jgi:2-methylisocitrate lyase-like PEP mutase family enzyme